MKVKELIMPRFEVIAEYPNCEFKKGETLVRIKNATNDWYHKEIYASTAGILLSDLEKYPHLFKKLNWWENRKEEEMPKYLKHRMQVDSENWAYDKIEGWDMRCLVGWLDEEEMKCCSLLSWSPEQGYFPAKKEDYENYIAKS